MKQNENNIPFIDKNGNKCYIDKEGNIVNCVSKFNKFFDIVADMIQTFLIKIKVIKTNGVNYEGKHSLDGPNFKNPITYLVLPIVILITIVQGVVWIIQDIFNIKR